MTHKRPVDMGAHRNEIEYLRAEARSYGYSLDPGATPASIRAAVSRLRAARKGKPPCYLRSYLPSAPECKICDLVDACAGSSPREFDEADMLRIACEVCGAGYLTVPLLDKNGDTKDYGCSEEGCPNTLLDQRRYIPHDAVREVPAKKKRTFRKVRKNIEDGDIARVMKATILSAGRVKTRSILYAAAPSRDAVRCKRILDGLLADGEVVEEKGKGFVLPKE